MWKKNLNILEMNIETLGRILEKKHNIYKIFGLATFLMAISLIYRWNGGDLKILDKSLLNGWSFSHTLLYMFASYNHPDKSFVLFMIGILWETIEYIGEKNNIPNVKFKKYDPLYNLVGILLGRMLQRNCTI